MPPKAIGPVWIVQPGDEHPAHPIVLPPDTPPDSGNVPAHPIFLPGEPTHPIAPGGETPEHPIVLPNPPDVGDAHPEHPIAWPDPYPDNSLPEGLQPVGELEFYQRKTLGINWDPGFDPAQAVGVYASEEDNDPVLVRTVANDGSSSVTYPQDYTGEVTIRVAGINGYLEGSTTIE
jgi:hypothetical protein